MIQSCTRLGPRTGGPSAQGCAGVDWAGRLSILLGACEEYQSSLDALPHLRAAMRSRPGLASLLESRLAEMQEAEQSLRYQVLGLLDDFATLIDGVGAPD